eukprot:2039766-Karenia_brevis.AAC.1
MSAGLLLGVRNSLDTRQVAQIVILDQGGALQDIQLILCRPNGSLPHSQFPYEHSTVNNGHEGSSISNNVLSGKKGTRPGLGEAG